MERTDKVVVFFLWYLHKKCQYGKLIKQPQKPKTNPQLKLKPQVKSLNQDSFSLEDFFTPNKINGQIQKEMHFKSEEAKR